MWEQGLVLLQALTDLDGIGKHDFTSLLFNPINLSRDDKRRTFSAGSSILNPAFLIALITAYACRLRMVKAWV